ncbi:NAD(P)-dependent oxidoreductase [Rhodococcus phenolicus]|uniref:NAD(P)-dependent oxidoreductase n=1 Tax=Rhodococcus phenolicus TaxID=263849 RepID=UPI0009EDD77B|nr:NAD(P)-dependent oxidoreductase [Rhodococcus phenolicus]
MTRVGFIGAGRMGLPMVRRLAEAGHDVRALGRSSETRAALTDAGITAVTEAAEAGVGAEIVLVCVFTDEQVREVCLDSALLEKMPNGSVLAIHTTVSPRTIEHIRDAAKAHGVDVIDAAVSGGPHDIAAGSLSLFVGGTADAVERATPVLRSYGDPVLHVGQAGNGQRVKLVNNALFAAQIGLISEAVVLGAQLGVEESALLGALPHGSSASKVMGNIAARGSVAGFTGAVREFLAKDVAVVRDTVAELGGDLGALDPAIDAGRPADHAR